MSLILREKPSSILTFAGNAINTYPSFISCDHISHTSGDVWLKENEQVSGSVSPACFLNVCHCALSTLQRVFSYEGCQGGFYGHFPAIVQILKLFSIYKYVDLPSQSHLPHFRLSLGDQEGCQFSCLCPKNAANHSIFWQ